MLVSALSVVALLVLLAPALALALALVPESALTLVSGLTLVSAAGVVATVDTSALVEATAGLALATAAAAAAAVAAVAAVVVAAFADLEVGVVLGREPHAASGNELVPGIVRARKVLFDHGDHFVDAVGTRDAEDLRHAVQNEVAAVGFLPAAEAAADDDAAVFLEGFGDRFETFFNRFVHEAAGVDDHEVGVVVAAPDAVAAGAQFGDDPFRVDERLGAAKRDETDDGDGVLHT